MRIGMFTDAYTPDINGVVSSIVTLKNALEKEGHEVYVITTKSSASKDLVEERVLRLAGIELDSFYGYVLTSPIALISCIYLLLHFILTYISKSNK